jgi:putative transposase
MVSKLSVWWLRLGIQIERIRPGHPEQNGRHERMHLTRKQEVTKPAASNALQQQARCDTFIKRFNHERPHQALAMKVPGEVYPRSPRPYAGLVPLTYPLHDWTGTVTPAVASATKTGRSTSARCLRDRTSASARWPITFG